MIYTIVNSMAQQVRAVRRRLYLTAIVPQPPLHIIVATHLLHQQVRYIIVLSLQIYMLEIVQQALLLICHAPIVVVVACNFPLVVDILAK